MKINAAGMEIIKREETLQTRAYLCPAGIPTIGYGHTGPDVHLGQAITAHEAEAILAADVERFEAGVATMVHGVPCNENQFSALVSLAFNIGLDALRSSTLIRKFRLGDVKGAEGEFSKWVHAKGQVLPGLVRRRQHEAQLFAKPV